MTKKTQQLLPIRMLQKVCFCLKHTFLYIAIGITQIVYRFVSTNSYNTGGMFLSETYLLVHSNWQYTNCIHYGQYQLLCYKKYVIVRKIHFSTQQLVVHKFYTFYSQKDNNLERPSYGLVRSIHTLLLLLLVVSLVSSFPIQENLTPSQQV